MFGFEMESRKKRPYLCENQYSPGMPSRIIFIFNCSLFLLGFIAMSVQILFIREALTIFNGNELVIGLCLGTWMLLTALGAYFGSLLRLSDKEIYGQGNRMIYFTILSFFIFLAALPFFMPWALAFLKSHFLPAGVMAGIGHIEVILTLSLAPFCLLSGTLFPMLASQLSKSRGRNLIHQAYALDSAGSILGGLLFSLIFFMMPQSTSLNLQASRMNKVLFPGQVVLESRNTPFGKLTITKLEEQYNLFENGNPVMLAGDATHREEMVHYAMLLHPKPLKVLMISGGIGGTIDEVFKYPGVQVDYVEVNPWMIQMVDKYVPFPRNDQVRFISKDPRIYLSQNDIKYDVILLNTPDPNSAETNRFYTLEFFRLIRDRLNEGGIVSLSIPAAGNYMSESSKKLHSVIYATMQSVFKNIKIIPGNRDYFLASDRGMDHSIWQNLNKSGIKNLYVNPGYIDENLMNARSNLILKEISTDDKINTDLKPYVYLQTYRQWLDQFKFDYRIIPAFLAILIILAFIFIGPVNLGLFIGGFTASSLEFILLIWFQVLFGIIYQMTGLIFATFMTGMAAGAIYMPKYFNTITFREFRKIQACFAIISILIAPLMLWVPYHSPSLAKVTIILSLVIITGFLMGALFSMTGHLKISSVISGAGQAFSADLAGSAIGILLVSVYLVPVIGMPMTCLVLAGLNVAAILKVAWRTL